MRQMKFIFAPDSFKGTLTSIQLADLLEKAARAHFAGCEVVKIPVADGGEGTVDALLTASAGRRIFTEVSGPAGKPVLAAYAIINSDTAVIEMAQASGLTLMPAADLNPLQTSSFGTGQLIRHALDHGIRKFLVGIGGSATNDGGVGAMMALGVRFTNAEGLPVAGNGNSLGDIQTIDSSGIHPAIAASEFRVICDVSNPLLGDNGATMVYGPQKGGTPEILATLEQNMIHLADAIERCLGIDVRSVPGAGAAGGMGAALLVFCQARLMSGVDAILDAVAFEKHLQGASLVITGEGRIDSQSVNGKVPVGVARRCASCGVPVIAIAGAMGEGAEQVLNCGIASIITSVSGIMPLAAALENAEALFLSAADRLFRILKVGYNLVPPGK